MLVIKVVTIRNMDKTPFKMVEGGSLALIGNREILHHIKTSIQGFNLPHRLLPHHHHLGNTSKDGSNLEDTSNNIHLRTSIQGFKLPHLLLPGKVSLSVVRVKTTLNRILVMHSTGIMEDQINKEHRRIRV